MLFSTYFFAYYGATKVQPSFGSTVGSCYGKHCPKERKEGMRYTAQIRIKRNSKIIHSESETFDKKSLAKAWRARRETELKLPGALEHVRHNGFLY